ncbi:centromere protein C isoform X2 [Impatiens glandulifera]|uniref:centromere protein C isoform X2 n=1 Tax=Impatiens glandulifera TaxID=253017 RepID=UPI001FB15350|nr:centromere protein C isoform X2 [Impatiens glandulifera]
MIGIGDGIQSSELMDPLQKLSGLSLFPRTFTDLKKKNVSNSSKSDALEFIHDSMKSKDCRSPNKLSEQANTIIDEVSELLDTNFASLVTNEKPSDTIREMRKGNPEERRPALGRKRPRFSMKPQSSQPDASLEPSLDIDKLEDPEEFLMAYEKLENARMELKRLKGSDLSTLDEHSPIRAEERRRPGLLGKAAHYKHHTYEKDDKIVVSQETSEQEIMNSNHCSPEKEAPIDETQERDIICSISETERRVNNVLDELLSDKCESLDGNGALSFLQEHLQIKPIDLDKLCLPDFPDVGKIDIKHVKEKLVKPPKVSSVVQNILKSISDKTPQKDNKAVPESPSSSIASPTPPKNPFASIYLLKKSILKSREKSHVSDVSNSDKMESTTNVHVDDRSPAEIIPYDSIDLSNKCSEMEDTDYVRRAANDTDILMTSNEMQKNVGDMPQEEDKPVSGSPRSTIASPSPPKNPFAPLFVLKRSTSKSRKKSHDALMSLDPFPSREFSDAEHFDQTMIDSDNTESTTNEHVEITVVDKSPTEIIACDSIHLSNKCVEMEDTDHFRGAANDNVILMTPNEMQENAGEVQQVALVQCQHDTDVTKGTPMINTSDQTEVQNKVQEIVEDQSHDAILDANIEFPASGTSKRSKAQLGQSSSVAVSLHATGEPSKSPVKVSVQENKEPSLDSRRNSKKPANGVRQRKKLSHRQSLADAGTSWTSGVRRSSRIKMRPLEYWKGERFLYGRVHESLTTVIGVKYMSPTKGEGKETLKVKPFKDEYSKLVEFAALH